MCTHKHLAKTCLLDSCHPLAASRAGLMLFLPSTAQTKHVFAGNLIKIWNEIITHILLFFTFCYLTRRPYMRIGFKHLSQQWIMGLRTFSPIRFTGKFQVRCSIGSGGPLLIVVKVGAWSCDMSASKSTMYTNVSNHWLKLDSISCCITLWMFDDELGADASHRFLIFSVNTFVYWNLLCFRLVVVTEY